MDLQRTVPGPLIDAKVGDRLIVKLTNSLPEAQRRFIIMASVFLRRWTGRWQCSSRSCWRGLFRYEFTLKDAGLFCITRTFAPDIQGP